MSNIRIIHTSVAPKPVPTRILLAILWRRFINFLWYLWFTARTKIPQIYIMTAALGLVCFMAFKSERMLPGAEPTCIPIPPSVDYVDPLPQVAPTLQEYVENVITTSQPSKPVKPAKYKNKVGAIPGNYSEYQVIIWSLMVDESFRPWRYPDGDHPSTAFGLNLTPEHKAWGAKKLGLKSFPSRVTWEQGKVLLAAYVAEHLAPVYKDQRLTPQQRVAKIIHAYNRGQASAKDVSNCCRARKGCGSKDPDIRKDHSRRRRFEVILMKGGLTIQMIEDLRAAAIAKEKLWKARAQKYVTCGI